MGKADSSKKGRKDEKKGGHRRLKIFTAALGAAVVILLLVLYVVYYQFAHEAKRLTKSAANVYAFGTGENMLTLIAPGYADYFDAKSQALSLGDIQSLYISRFQSYANERVGEIEDIDCRITDIMAVSNVEDVESMFAQNGVDGVSQYRSVNADWVVTGKDGSITVQVKVCVLRCDDGWFVDYVLLPDDISGMDQTDDDSSIASGTDAETDL